MVEMVEMVEVVIDSVRVSLTNQQRIVLLREMDVDHYLPIWIGPYEAEAITISLQEIEIARPQTHDLLIQTLEKMNARLTRVEIVALRGDVFYGNLVIESGDQTIFIDARPSDSIALAVRAHIPILVAKEVMKSAGISPERDLQQEFDEIGLQQLTEKETDDSKERLSVFEEFLQKVDLEDLSDDSQTNSPGTNNLPDPKL
ncbi:MAG: bifunctional nuclease family protein [Chloroflexi bacterium]|nr:bifunctional nuclease family protein [Chloroflexota bacterium]